jgi:hypothetical protein
MGTPMKIARVTTIDAPPYGIEQNFWDILSDFEMEEELIHLFGSAVEGPVVEDEVVVPLELDVWIDQTSFYLQRATTTFILNESELTSARYRVEIVVSKLNHDLALPSP